MVGEKRVRRMHSCADDSKNKMAFYKSQSLSYREQGQENFLRNLRNSTEKKPSSAPASQKKKQLATWGIIQNFILKKSMIENMKVD